MEFVLYKTDKTFSCRLRLELLSIYGNHIDNVRQLYFRATRWMFLLVLHSKPAIEVSHGKNCIKKINWVTVTWCQLVYIDDVGQRCWYFASWHIKLLPFLGLHTHTPPCNGTCQTCAHYTRNKRRVCRLGASEQHISTECELDGRMVKLSVEAYFGWRTLHGRTTKFRGVATTADQLVDQAKKEHSLRHTIIM